MNRICYEGVIRPAGWKRLPSIRRITDTLSKCGIFSFDFEPIRFIHPKSACASSNVKLFSAAFGDLVNNEGKASVAMVFGHPPPSQLQPTQPQQHPCHAVTLKKEENQNYVLKNSYLHTPWINIPTNLPPRK